MGVRHSKEKAKRYSLKRRRQKRQSPEGESWDSHGRVKIDESNEVSPCHHHLCPCNNKPASLREFDANNSAHKITKQSPTEHTDRECAGFLKVSLPDEKKTKEPSPSRPMQQTLSINSGWTLTFETNNKALSHLVSSLHPHIESVHLDEERGKNIRVRLADNLTPNKTNNLERPPSTSPTSSPQAACTSRIHTLSGDESDDNLSNPDRVQYYRQIPGKDNHRSSDNLSAHSKLDSEILSGNRSASRSRSRDRSCHGYCRRHSRECGAHRSIVGSGKSSRYHSPFDQQSFQEAMMLRLTELQKKSSRHAQIVRAAAADSNQSSSDGKENSDSEYSGDDDNRVIGDSPRRDCSQMFEPLSNLNSKVPNIERGIQEKKLMTSVELGYSECESDKKKQSLILSKPWDKQTCAHNSKKKNLTKKRSSNGLKRTHGYLRASSAIQKGDLSFPNTPKSSTNLTASDGIQRHQHEHIHHHFYYNCQSET